MTSFQKITNILWGISTIVVAIALFMFPRKSYIFVLLILSVGMLISGIGLLGYFFIMARYMVGGKLTLYKGVILLDFALLTISLTDVPRYYVIFYLVVVHAFTGFVEILRAREAWSYGAKIWMLKFAHGVVDIAMALCCIIFIRKTNTAVFIYSIGLVYSGIMRLVTGLRKTPLVYVQ